MTTITGMVNFIINHASQNLFPSYSGRFDCRRHKPTSWRSMQMRRFHQPIKKQGTTFRRVLPVIAVSLSASFAGCGGSDAGPDASTATKYAATVTDISVAEAV